MSFRLLLLGIYVAFFAVYAWRNWFISLCATILLMAVIEHPDMPNSMGGVQGLNPWNILMLSVLLAWATQRRQQGLRWDLPSRPTKWLLLYLLVILVGFVRMWSDRSYLEDVSGMYMISEYLINCIKWVLPAALLFDACRTRQRLKIALGCVLAIYVLLAIQVIRWMPLRYAISGGALDARSAKIILNEVGYHRVNMSMILAGGTWAVVAAAGLFRERTARLAVLMCAGACTFGQALTAGRTGYLTWGLVGGVLCTLRWRKLLILPPILVVCIMLFLPGVYERLTQGFGGNKGSVVTATDEYSITSGRTVAWPYVIDKIWESPLIGHGRQAMRRTGIAYRLMSELEENFPHPHNAYLEQLLDNGIVGFLCVIPFYLLVLYRAFPLFMDKTDPLRTAIGGATLALVMALLIASVGSQTFYPREGAVGMWAMIALMFRVSSGIPVTGADEGTEEGTEPGLIDSTRPSTA